MSSAAVLAPAADNSVALVTGASRGIGTAVCVGLMRRGLHVVMGCRNLSEGRVALERATAEAEGGSAELLHVDLSHQASIRAAVKAFQGRHGSLHLLVNNAAVMTRRRCTTVDGWESTLAVNYLAPFLLTTLLRDSLAAADSASVINVVSALHYRAQLDWDDLQLTRHFDPQAAYARSKLALAMFTVELGRRFAAVNVRASSVDPGGVATDLMRDLSWPARFVSRLLFMRAAPAVGAEPILRVSDTRGSQGAAGYFERNAERTPHTLCSDPRQTARLWVETERLLGTAS